LQQIVTNARQFGPDAQPAPLHRKKLVNIGNFVLLWANCERDSGPGVTLEGRFSLDMNRWQNEHARFRLHCERLRRIGSIFCRIERKKTGK
jgi:hypothetical protein